MSGDIPGTPAAEPAAPASAPRTTVPAAVRKIARNALDLRSYGIVYAVILLFVVLSVTSPIFLTTRNLLNLLDAWAPITIMALGGTFVLLSGGFDLSIGGIYVVSGVVAATVSNLSSGELGLLAGIGAGIAVGLFNGLVITQGKINPFVATIGGSILLTGLATVISGGLIIHVTDFDFGVLGNRYYGIYASIFVLIGVMILASLLLNRTSLGRYVRAVGGNSEAARLSGIRINLVVTLTYVISGLTGGLAAIIVAGSTLSSTNSTTIAFSVWAAILLGGNSMYGGIGSVWRTVSGALMLGLIQNGFTLLSVSAVYQQVATGGIFLAAVVLDSMVRRADGGDGRIRRSSVW